jgi:hypothetical protein
METCRGEPCDRKEDIAGLPALSFPFRITQPPDLTTSRALEMEVTMVGLQNAGKTSLLRVLAVRFPLLRQIFLRDVSASPLSSLTVRS